MKEDVGVVKVSTRIDGMICRGSILRIGGKNAAATGINLCHNALAVLATLLLSNRRVH